MKIRCKKCGYTKEVKSVYLIKIFGWLILVFGCLSWTSYRFAGTGFAMLFCIGIIFMGYFMGTQSEKVAKWLHLGTLCDKCKSPDWDALV